MAHVRRVRMDLVIGVELGTTTLLGYQSLELSQLPNSFQTFETSTMPNELCAKSQFYNERR